MIKIAGRKCKSEFDTGNKAITKVLAVGLAIVVCVAVAIGVYYASLALNPSNGTQTEGDTETKTPPDLVVTQIVFMPAQPVKQKYFRAEVWVANIGETKSGSYDLVILLKDYKGNIYSFTGYGEDRFRQDPVGPGKTVLAWASDTVMVNDAVWHTFYVKIDPVDFNDGNYGNNDFSEGFEALGK